MTQRLMNGQTPTAHFIAQGDGRCSLVGERCHDLVVQRCDGHWRVGVKAMQGTQENKHRGDVHGEVHSEVWRNTDQQTSTHVLSREEKKRLLRHSQLDLSACSGALQCSPRHGMPGQAHATSSRAFNLRRCDNHPPGDAGEPIGYSPCRSAGLARPPSRLHRAVPSSAPPPPPLSPPLLPAPFPSAAAAMPRDACVGRVHAGLASSPLPPALFPFTRPQFVGGMSVWSKHMNHVHRVATGAAVIFVVVRRQIDRHGGGVRGEVGRGAAMGGWQGGWRGVFHTRRRSRCRARRHIAHLLAKAFELIALPKAIVNGRDGALWFRGAWRERIRRCSSWGGRFEGK